jgi:N-acetylmuramoyl-L-alanine amidase
VLTLGASGPDVSALQEKLWFYGYSTPRTGQYDGTTMEVVAAFQRHYRPARIDGIADPSTLATLDALIASLPERPSHLTPLPPHSMR